MAKDLKAPGDEVEHNKSAKAANDVRAPCDVLIEEYACNAKHQERDLKTVKNDLVLKIDKEDANKDGANHHVDASERNALLPKQEGAKQPQKGVCKLNRRVAEGNVRFAAAALAAQHQVRKHGNVVVPTQLVFAGGAMRIWLCNAHVVGPAVDEHVEKAAHTKP